MRSPAFLLPAVAVLLAAGVLAAAVGGSLAVASPDVPEPQPAPAVADRTEPASTGWQETGNKPPAVQKSPKHPSRKHP